jgi:flagellar motor protein MotB
MPNTQNASIVAIYQSLNAQQDALSEAIQKTTDPQLADAISTESSEVLHRIILTQNLLFQSDSAELQKNASAVTNASGRLQSAILAVDNVSNLVNGVSTYLALVDKAIDLAKTLAPLAA